MVYSDTVHRRLERRLLLGALLAGSLQACAGRSAKPSAGLPSNVAVPSAEAPSAAPPPETDGLPPELDLPHSVVSAPVPRDAVRVAISREALWIGSPWRRVVGLPPQDRQPQIGFGERTKRGPANDLYVLPLAEAAKSIVCSEPRTPARAVLFVEATTPYRILIETVFTLRHGFDEMYFAVATETGKAALPLALTTASLHQRGTTVLLSSRGYRVSHPDSGWFGPGCSEPGDELSVPLLNGAHDIDSLVRCARTARASGRAALSIAAAPQIPMRLVVSTVGAVMADAQAGDPVTALKLLVPIDRDLSSAVNDTASTKQQPGYADAATTVAGMRSGFRSCYKQQLAKNPSAAGSVHLSIRVAADGSVSAVSSATSGDLGDVPACMKQIASATRFAPPVGGSAVIKVPVTFVRQNELREKRCWTEP